VVGHEENRGGVSDLRFFCGGHALLEACPASAQVDAAGQDALRRARPPLLADPVHPRPDAPRTSSAPTLMIERPRADGFFSFQPGGLSVRMSWADEVKTARPPSTQSATARGHAGAVRHRRRCPPHPGPTLLRPGQPRTRSEMEGHLSLPEAQLDRFLLKLRVDIPSADEAGRDHRPDHQAAGRPGPQSRHRADVEGLKALVPEVPIAQPTGLRDPAGAGHTPGPPGAPEMSDASVRYGSSPRGAQALVLGGNGCAPDRRALSAP